MAQRPRCGAFSHPSWLCALFGLIQPMAGPATPTSPPVDTQQWACQYRHPLEQSPTESGLILQLLHHFIFRNSLCGNTLCLACEKIHAKTLKAGTKLELATVDLECTQSYEDLKQQPKGGGTQNDFYNNNIVDIIPSPGCMTLVDVSE